MIRTAVRDIESVSRPQPDGQRRAVLSIDRWLALLEQAHLADQVLRGTELAEVISNLLPTIPGPPPGEVVRATDSVALHGALLDWQERFLPQPWYGLS